jgi:hypothetical protein
VTLREDQAASPVVAKKSLSSSSGSKERKPKAAKGGTGDDMSLMQPKF